MVPTTGRITRSRTQGNESTPTGRSVGPHTPKKPMKINDDGSRYIPSNGRIKDGQKPVDDQSQQIKLTGIKRGLEHRTAGDAAGRIRKGLNDRRLEIQYMSFNERAELRANLYLEIGWTFEADADAASRILADVEDE